LQRWTALAKFTPMPMEGQDEIDVNGIADLAIRLLAPAVVQPGGHGHLPARLSTCRSPWMPDLGRVCSLPLAPEDVVSVKFSNLATVVGVASFGDLSA
jgi:hypothetical protein